eukprot:IDg9306t1
MLFVDAGLSKFSLRKRRNPSRVGSVVCLNRLLFASSEVSNLRVKLPFSDFRAAHVRDVLRLSTGGRVRAGVLEDALYDEVPVNVGTEHVSFALDAAIAALGVQHLALVNAYRVERCYFDSALLRDPLAVRSALVHGLMQAGTDTRVPAVHVGRRLRVFLEDELHRIAPHGAVRVVAHPGGATSMLHRLASSEHSQAGERSKSQHIMLAIGPEGGWMPRELSMLEMFGFQTANLGSRVLRTDTAVLVLLGLVSEWQRYRPKPPHTEYLA